MKITPDQVFEIQSKVTHIKNHAEDRTSITEDCDRISEILKEVIRNGTLS